MDHSKLIVQSDQMFTSVIENEREKERKSENKRARESKKNSMKAIQAIDNMVFQAFSICTQVYCHVMLKIPLFFGLLVNSLESE